MAEYINKQDALDAFELSEKTRKYGGDHSGYDTRMLYEIQDTIESIEPADVISKADMITLLEETEREVLKGINRYSTHWIMIDSIFGIVKCKVNMLGEKTDE